MATSEKWTDKQTNERQERTTWHYCEAWGRLAEVCGEYLRKGSKVYVEGKIRQEEWEKDGQTHRMTKVRIDGVQFLSGRDDSQPQQSTSQPQQSTSQPSSAPDDDGFSDDIPFAWILAPIGGAIAAAEGMLQVSSNIIA